MKTNFKLYTQHTYQNLKQTEPKLLPRAIDKGGIQISSQFPIRERKPLQLREAKARKLEPADELKNKFTERNKNLSNAWHSSVILDFNPLAQKYDAKNKKIFEKSELTKDTATRFQVLTHALYCANILHNKAELI